MDGVKLPLVVAVMAAITTLLALSLLLLDILGRPADPVLVDAFRIAIGGTMSTLAAVLVAQRVNGK